MQLVVRMAKILGKARERTVTWTELRGGFPHLTQTPGAEVLYKHGPCICKVGVRAGASQGSGKDVNDHREADEGGQCHPLGPLIAVTLGHKVDIRRPSMCGDNLWGKSTQPPFLSDSLKLTWGLCQNPQSSAFSISNRARLIKLTFMRANIVESLLARYQ